MSIPVPKLVDHCKRCGTITSPGLIICAVCAAKFNIAPSETFARKLSVTARPPYEQHPTPTDSSGDDK